MTTLKGPPITAGTSGRTRHTQGQHSGRLRRSQARQTGSAATSRRQCNNRVVTSLSPGAAIGVSPRNPPEPESFALLTILSTFDQLDSGVQWVALCYGPTTERVRRIGLTPIPADVRAGVDRSIAAVLERDNAIFDTIISPSGITTLETPSILQRLQSLVTSHNEQISVRREQAMTMKPLEQTTIPQEAIEKAIATQLERSEALQSLTKLPAEVAKLSETIAADAQANMEYRAKLDALQYQPQGRVLQLDTWDPALHQTLDLGRVLRLEQQGDLGFPKGDPDTWTLERSFQEQMEMEAPGRNVASRVPWQALEERERQLSLQRATMANGAGARPTDVTLLGNGGLVFAGFAPILARMRVEAGVRGAMKLPWASTQPSAAAGAEGSDITTSNLVLSNAEFLPKSIASAYELTSSLEASDDGTFLSLIDLAIRSVVSEQLVSQVLVGGGTDEISGIWGLTGVPNVNYGAQGEFDRQDALDVLDSVRLADTDGGTPLMVASKGLWQLMQKTPRGTDGTSSAGYTEINRFVLDDMMYRDEGAMGMVEGTECHYFSELKPASVMDPGLVFKAGDLATPTGAAKYSLRLLARRHGQLTPEIEGVNNELLRLTAETAMSQPRTIWPVV